MTRVNCGRVLIGTPRRAARLGVAPVMALATVEPAAKRLALVGHG
jgi:hypothetical protein